MKNVKSRGLATLGAIAITAVLGQTAAFAGSCPADKVTTEGQKAGATAHKDVAEKLLGQMDALSG